MKALLTPKPNTAGFFQGSSRVGGRDVIIADPTDAKYSIALVRGRLVPVNEVKFPDEATTEGFYEVFNSCVADFNPEKDGDYDEFYINALQMASEAYRSELTDKA